MLAVQETNQLLLGCGASIEEVNAVRKHLSKIKGGRLARAAFPSHVVSLVLSDVIADRVDVIASGPTVGDPSTLADCATVIGKYLEDRLPSRTRALFCKSSQSLMNSYLTKRCPWCSVKKENASQDELSRLCLAMVPRRRRSQGTSALVTWHDIAARTPDHVLIRIILFVCVRDADNVHTEIVGSNTLALARARERSGHCQAGCTALNPA